MADIDNLAQDEILSGEKTLDARIEELKEKYPAFNERLTAILTGIKDDKYAKEKAKYLESFGPDNIPEKIPEEIEELLQIKAQKVAMSSKELIDKLEKEFSEDWAGEFGRVYEIWVRLLHKNIETYDLCSKLSANILEELFEQKYGRKPVPLSTDKTEKDSPQYHADQKALYELRREISHTVLHHAIGGSNFAGTESNVFGSFTELNFLDLPGNRIKEGFKKIEILIDSGKEITGEEEF